MCQAAGQGSHGKELKPVEVAERLAREEDARGWIETLRCPQGPCCPHCVSTNVQCSMQHQSQRHRCRESTTLAPPPQGEGGFPESP